MALKYEDIKKHMVPHEGNIPWMYLDTVGKVTVGIGNMLPDVASAQALSFVNRTTKSAATKDEIKADFEAVSKQLMGQAAKKYKDQTKLDLPDLNINELFKARIAEFTKQLTKYFPDYDKFPDPAQLAILDMAFNLGAPALDKKWPSLKKAVLAQDWVEAEKQCNRTTCNAGRNDSTKALFREAATQAKAATAASGKK